MSEDRVFKLSLADHVVIHACCFFLSGPVRHDNDAMIQDMLLRALPHATEDNPQLAPYLDAAREFASRPTADLRGASAGRSQLLIGFHARRLAAAWDQLRESLE